MTTHHKHFTLNYKIGEWIYRNDTHFTLCNIHTADVILFVVVKILRPPSRRRHLQVHFSLNENFWILNKISLKYVPGGPVDNKYARIGSDNGLAPTGRQTILWTNDG